MLTPVPGQQQTAYSFLKRLPRCLDLTVLYIPLAPALYLSSNYHLSRTSNKETSSFQLRWKQTGLCFRIPLPTGPLGCCRVRGSVDPVCQYASSMEHNAN